MSSPTAPAAAGSLALSDRVILVTGAYGGLGEAAAKACAQAGATVVLLGRKVPKLSRTYDAVKALGPTPALYPLDLAGADPADYEQLASTIESEMGGLHWGTYGVAKAGLLGLVRVLHDETDRSSVRVSALQPGPMRTTIRSRAYVEEAASRVPSPDQYAGACVRLLSAGGIESRGQVVTLDLAS
ncbi:MAG: SDR family NAD(P)-dependent oxidoreductase [Gammaproteobacteria bacterium]|nr:SDR family NAD(P)-dependent oxidoreductase [Gammaproteobacteria bacterium]